MLYYIATCMVHCPLKLAILIAPLFSDLPETKEFPKGVLGDVTDDEDYRTAFSGELSCYVYDSVKSRVDSTLSFLYDII